MTIEEYRKIRNLLADKGNPSREARLQGFVDSHEHMRVLEGFSTVDPEPCGSQYFLKISNAVIGFDRGELLEFRDAVEALVDKLLGAASEDAPGLSCIMCGKAVTQADGFNTTIGWMHEECNQENKIEG